ncbi:MAG TPA: hypothetical protein VG225_06105 [Terracidiphilus sp.]|jgi:hypothetical protein|nr:hypothetical protein [Terracidiphilus sp.]
MLAVSNTSPISNLGSIGHLELLKLQFSVVLIPTAVVDELAAHPDPAARSAIEQGLQLQWIRVAAVEDSGLLRVLLSQLHRGEAEAIGLAAALNADIVLLDEHEGRQLASKVGLGVTGVLAYSCGPSAGEIFRQSGLRSDFCVPEPASSSLPRWKPRFSPPRENSSKVSLLSPKYRSIVSKPCEDPEPWPMRRGSFLT